MAKTAEETGAGAAGQDDRPEAEPAKTRDSKIDAAHDYLITGAKKEDSDMKPLLSQRTELEAHAAAAALRLFNYRVDVWHRITEKK